LRNVTLLCAALAAPAAAAAAEPATIVALGDSLTAGYGLAEGEGFVPQLQAWLDAQGAAAVVVNAGVSGDTTAGGLARLDWALGPDSDAVIVALGGNDLLRGLDPAASRANLEAILSEVRGRGLPVLLVGLPAPGNFGPEYKTAFDAMFPDLAAAQGALLAPSFFAGLGPAAADPAALAPFLQADGIHPNAEGVARIVEGLGPQVLELLAAVP
jgi:acyl-CoA thioesterase-1